MPARIALLMVFLIGGVLAGLLWLAPPHAVPADAAGSDFSLPYEAGRKLFTLQGQEQGSHTGVSQQFAYDFSLAPFDGSSFTVVASRAGTVKGLRLGSEASPDCDIRFYSLANYVLLDHGDGIGTMYSHLLKDSLLVTPGQKVIQGQPLARSDHSGYICGTGHLHFTVLDLKTYAGLDRPFADRDAQRDGGRPRTGQWYTADTAAQRAASVTVYRTFLPFMRKR